MNTLQGGPGDPIGAVSVQVQHAMNGSEAVPSVDDLKGRNKEDAAQELEQLFLTLLVKEMRETLPEGFFAKGPATSVYAGLFDQVLAESLASGKGTGLRQAIVDGWPDGAKPGPDSADARKASVLGVSERTTP
ncbi:MAG: hypothetical protein CMJ83_08280 [Planctomycetes bacterium]|jgi:Rod binding domain-containing protein|nr:hypothetical protein [Planctomycetota bacterium]